MLHLKKLLVLPMVAIALSGCNSGETSVGSNDPEMIVSDEQANAAREDVLERLEIVSNERKEGQEEVGYVTEESFAPIRNGFNIIANAIGSKALIAMNDDDHMNEQFNTLEKDIDSLSSEEIYVAMKDIDTFKNVYEAAFMKDIHTDMKILDPNGPDGEIYGFNLVNDSSTPIEEINESADLSIDRLAWVKDDLELIKLETEKYGTDFTEEEVEKLNKIVSSLKDSANSQIGVFSNFTKIKVDIGITFEEYIDEAKEEYATGEEAVTDLENELNVTYIEEE
ncbi:hypothetical protein ACIQZM_18115 [Peribacillus sp. NPDC097206]|uniref:hypothetical protein n=1 Tax=unclassified Peribacillus TaxID=2675266 RepID=UPI00380E076C